MKKDMTVYIQDILDSITLIEVYIKGLRYKDFEGNISVQDSVMRRFEIIGEAGSRLTLKYRNKNSKIPWRKIIGLRNIIIHEYSTVNLKTIWKIAKKDLPKTKKQIEILKIDSPDSRVYSQAELKQFLKDDVLPKKLVQKINKKFYQKKI